jgi:hypothetical protein
MEGLDCRDRDSSHPGSSRPGAGDKLIPSITLDEMQQLLDETAKECGRSVVDHLRFRLRSIFTLAISEGATERNPAASLFTPKHYKSGREKRVLSPEQSRMMLEAEVRK